MKPRFFVYILMNDGGSVLYIGLTRDLVKRTAQHRAGSEGAFTTRYGAHRLVYFEAYPRVAPAIRREKQLKSWRRSKKEDLVRSQNPDLRDLADEAARIMASLEHSQIYHVRDSALRLV